MNNGANLPFIPETVTVHLAPPAAPGENVTVPFADYIKNVASSEIYPTWSDSAIRANVLAQISFTLNRIYTEYYRSRGYGFDITNSTTIDQSYVFGRDIFDNIGMTVDEIFNDYLVREGAVEPLFASYCNGTTVTCDGMSQWGSESLGRAGRTAFEILTNYYGDDISIVEDAPVAAPTESYPGVALRRGSSGNDVAFVQIRLNRIGRNYPAIPGITEEDGIFGDSTEEAVRAFQRIFSLTEDGIVGRATWYKIQQIYSGVRSLSELTSEGIPIEDVTDVGPRELGIGDRGTGVVELQYLLDLVGDVVPFIPRPDTDGIYGDETASSVSAFQTYYGLDPTGEADTVTWQKLVAVYRGILETLPEGSTNSLDSYFGTPLTVGDSGIYVERVQRLLDYLSNYFPAVPKVTVDGIYGSATAAAVRAFQEAVGLEPTGRVGAATYSRLVSLYREYSGENGI